MCDCGHGITRLLYYFTAGDTQTCGQCIGWSTSAVEQEVFAVVKSITSEAVNGAKIDASRFTWDVVVPSAKLAIEFNGVLWHSTKFKSDRLVHERKRLAAEAAGYRQITIWEDEWRANPERCKRFIADALCKDRTFIDADQASAEPIQADDANEWHEHINMQGSAPKACTAHIALKHAGQIVAVASFEGSHLARYSVRERFTVDGGLRKAIACAQLDAVTAHCDRDHFTGDLLRTEGFTFLDGAPKATYLVKNIRQAAAVHGAAVCWNSGVDKWLLSH